MTVKLSVHDGKPVSIQLPQRVTLEVLKPSRSPRQQTASILQTRDTLQRRPHQRAAAHQRREDSIVVMTETARTWSVRRIEVAPRTSVPALTFASLCGTLVREMLEPRGTLVTL